MPVPAGKLMLTSIVTRHGFYFFFSEDKLMLPDMMTAILIARAGGPEVLQPATRPVPHPEAGQVLIKVALLLLTK